MFWFDFFQLSNGDLKRVEELTTEDFVQSAKFSIEVGIDQVNHFYFDKLMRLEKLIHF